MSTKGAANANESKRSRMPPCPRKKLLLSLISASLFNKDSAKSPNCPNMPIIKPILIASTNEIIDGKKSYFLKNKVSFFYCILLTLIRNINKI